MTKTVPRVIVIPANPELEKVLANRRQLRVAAYCRVSTDDEEQLTSYEAQKLIIPIKSCQIPNGRWREFSRIAT